jgi:hypothetical protein
MSRQGLLDGKPFASAAPTGAVCPNHARSLYVAATAFPERASMKLIIWPPEQLPELRTCGLALSY